MGEAEAGTSAIIGVYPDASAEALDDELADGETQAAALGVLVEFLKAVEHLLALFGGDATSGISHAEEGHLSLYLQSQGDASFRCELGGINQQVDKELLQTCFIGMEGQLCQFGLE